MHQRLRVLRLIRLQHVETVVLEALLQRRLQRLPSPRIQAPVLQQLLLHVLENVLPRSRLGGTPKNERD